MTDGYEQESGTTLVQNGDLALVQQSDNARLEVNPGQFATFQFDASVLDSAPLQSVAVYVEHHEKNGMQPNSVEWQVGVGSLTAPTVLQSTNPGLNLGAGNEAVAGWDVSASIDTTSEVNDLKLVIHNHSNNKKMFIDHVLRHE